MITDACDSYKLYKTSFDVHKWTREQHKMAKAAGQEAPDGEMINFQTPQVGNSIFVDENGYRLNLRTLPVEQHG